VITSPDGTVKRTQRWRLPLIGRSVRCQLPGHRAPIGVPVLALRLSDDSKQ